jgi:hypothetical protein
MSIAALRHAWSNTTDMPPLLRVFCQGAMVVTPLLLLLLAVPLFDWTVGSQTMSYAELWQSGAGATLSACVLVWGIGAWGLAARAPRARWALVAAPSVPLLSLLFFPAWSGAEGLGSAASIGSALLTSVVVYVVLFFVPAVRRYVARATHA